MVSKDDYFEVIAKVSGMSSSSSCFVQGMFTSKDSNRYFGFTWSKNGDWLRYDSSPEKSFVLENYIQLQNDQETKILLKPDFTDKDYKGPGEYLVKLKRYTASGSGGDYSENSLIVNLSFALPTTNPTPSESKSDPTSTPTFNIITPTKSSTSTPTKSPSLIKTSTISPTGKPHEEGEIISTQNSDVLGISTSSSIPTTNLDIASSSPSSKSQSSLDTSDKNIFLIGSGIFAISGVLLYFRLKSL